MNTIIKSLGMIFAIIVAAASAVLEIAIINVSHAQETPGQNPMCDPNDKFVNTTESKICGVPATIKANNTATTPVSPGPSSILSSSP